MNKMIKNMGSIDRRIRAFVIAPLLLIASWALGFATVGGVIAIVLAVVMIATASVGSCPLYVPLKINTDENRKSSGSA